MRPRETRRGSPARRSPCGRSDHRAASDQSCLPPRQAIGGQGHAPLRELLPRRASRLAAQFDVNESIACRSSLVRKRLSSWSGSGAGLSCWVPLPENVGCNSLSESRSATSRAAGGHSRRSGSRAAHRARLNSRQLPRAYRLAARNPLPGPNAGRRRPRQAPRQRSCAVQHDPLPLVHDPQTVE